MTVSLVELGLVLSVDIVARIFVALRNYIGSGWASENEQVA